MAIIKIYNPVTQQWELCDNINIIKGIDYLTTDDYALMFSDLYNYYIKSEA